MKLLENFSEKQRRIIIIVVLILIALFIFLGLLNNRYEREGQYVFDKWFRVFREIEIW